MNTTKLLTLSRLSFQALLNTAIEAARPKIRVPWKEAKFPN